MRAAFTKGKPLGEVAEPRQGLATTDNAQFTRQWWEVGPANSAFGCASRDAAQKTGARWFPYNKGGDYRKWWGNQGLVADWEDDGTSIKQIIAEKYPYLNGKYEWVAKNMDTYFLPSLSWSKISSGDPAFREYPAGFIFDVAGTSIFTDVDRRRESLLAICNSSVTLSLLKAIAPTLNFEVGVIAKLPIVLPEPVSEVSSEVVDLVATARADWDSDEISWGFCRNHLIAAFRIDTETCI